MVLGNDLLVSGRFHGELNVCQLWSVISRVLLIPGFCFFILYKCVVFYYGSLTNEDASIRTEYIIVVKV